MKRILLDTGPLVASLLHRDPFHGWAVATLDGIKTPVFTCEAVLAEACFLLRGVRGGPAAVLHLVRCGALVVDFRLAADVEPVQRLMKRYGDVPMSLADACLVRMAELHEDTEVITLDGDFRVYRRHGRRLVPLITPPA